MAINRKEITSEQIMKAVQCRTADELMKLAKAEGFDMSMEEADAYMAELDDIELDEQVLRNVAGGTCITDGTSCWTLN